MQTAELLTQIPSFTSYSRELALVCVWRKRRTGSPSGSLSTQVNLLTLLRQDSGDLRWQPVRFNSSSSSYHSSLSVCHMQCTSETMAPKAGWEGQRSQVGMEERYQCPREPAPPSDPQLNASAATNCCADYCRYNNTTTSWDPLTLKRPLCDTSSLSKPLDLKVSRGKEEDASPGQGSIYPRRYCLNQQI